MKRVFFILIAVVLTSVTLFTSCSDDTEEPNLPPTISFLTADTLISANATVTVGETFYIGINAIANATSQSKIATLRITRITNNQMFLDQTENFNDDNISVIVEFEALNDPGTENIEFTVTDKDGQSAKKSLTITAEAAAGGQIDSWTERLLGSWNNPTGSSFASVNGMVYTLDQAFANQSLIDYMYWWGASTSATIGAPDDANAALVFNSGNYQLANWTTKNPTRFKTTTLTATEFEAITDDTKIIENATGADQTRIGGLTVDQVIAFKTVTGKYGLIRVKAITNGSDGTLTMDVKVQK